MNFMTTTMSSDPAQKYSQHFRHRISLIKKASVGPTRAQQVYRIWAPKTLCGSSECCSNLNRCFRDYSAQPPRGKQQRQHINATAITLLQCNSNNNTSNRGNNNRGRRQRCAASRSTRLSIAGSRLSVREEQHPHCRKSCEILGGPRTVKQKVVTVRCSPRTGRQQVVIARAVRGQRNKKL